MEKSTSKFNFAFKNSLAADFGYLLFPMAYLYLLLAVNLPPPCQKLLDNFQMLQLNYTISSPPEHG